METRCFVRGVPPAKVLPPYGLVWFVGGVLAWCPLPWPVRLHARIKCWYVFSMLYCLAFCRGFSLKSIQEPKGFFCGVPLDIHARPLSRLWVRYVFSGGATLFFYVGSPINIFTRPSFRIKVCKWRDSPSTLFTTIVKQMEAIIYWQFKWHLFSLPLSDLL